MSNPLHWHGGMSEDLFRFTHFGSAIDGEIVPIDIEELPDDAITPDTTDPLPDDEPVKTDPVPEDDATTAPVETEKET